MSSKNSNKLNIPEAKAAMNKFKMEAASEVDVPSTYYDFYTDELRPTTYCNKKRPDVNA